MAAILSAIGLLTGFFKDLKELFSDSVGRAVLLMAGFLIVVGTIFYDLVEGWGLVDSFYFSVVTLTTVGYGDFSPETTAGKLFTTVYIFSGLRIITAVASSIAKKHAQRIADRANEHAQRKIKDDARDT